MKTGLNLAGFLPYRLSVASNMVSDVISDAYRSLFGLSIPEWRLIAVLAPSGWASQQDLAAATRMDKVAVSRAVSRLVERALVEQVAQADDRRSRRLSLTGSGRALYSQVAPKALELEAQLLTEFSEEEVGELSAMLLRLEAAAAGVARALGQSDADATVART